MGYSALLSKSPRALAHMAPCDPIFTVPSAAVVAIASFLMLNPSDRLSDLLARCALGDQQALAEIFRLTRSRLFAVALRLLRDADRAEEALQESFLKIWRSSGSYKPELGAASTWLTSIVRNQSLDLLRAGQSEREHRVPLDEDEDMLEQVPDNAPDPMAQAMQGQSARNLARCMEALRAEQQELIVRAYYEGLTHSELSAGTGLALGTVKTHVRRGLAALRACLTAGGSEGGRG